MQFSEQTLRGVRWSFIGQVGKFLLITTTHIILLRLLSPDTFGLVAMVIVFTGFANVVVDMGFGPAIIQRDHNSQAALSSIFWVNLGLGILVALILIIASPIIVFFYGQEELLNLLLAMSLNFVLVALPIVHKSLLIKAIQFNKIAQIELSAHFISAIIAIYLALTGWEVWSLVALQLANHGILVFLFFIFSKWQPQFFFNSNAIRPYFSFSLQLFLNETTRYWAYQIDQLLIGRYLGTLSLGWYSQGYRLTNMPIKYIAHPVSNVFFPTMVQQKENPQAIQESYLLMMRFINFFTFPLLAFFASLPDLFIGVILGDAWINSAPLFPLFAGLMFITSISMGGPLFLAKGAGSIILRLGLISRTAIIIACLIGLKWGLIGVLWGRIVAEGITRFLHLFYVRQLSGLSFLKQIKNLSFPILAAVVIIVCNTLCRYIINGFAIPELVQLLILPLISLGLVITLFWWLKPKGYSFLHQFLPN